MDKIGASKSPDVGSYPTTRAMTKKEAIKLANSKPRNMKLQYYVIKWGRGYALAPSSYMARNPDVSFVYVTTGEKGATIKIYGIFH